MAPLALIGIDHGTKRTGFAVSDALRIACEPVGAVEGGTDAVLAHVAGLLEERDVEAFVIGLPLNMDGSEGPRSAEVRAFGDALKRRFPDVRVAYQDERLSTKAAEELLRETGWRPARGNKHGRDAMSAVVILRDWIEAGEPA